MRWLKIAAALLLPGGVALLYAALLYAPTEAFMGDVQRIFYIHVAMAWNGYLAFAIVLVAGVAYLRSRAARWDWLGESAAETGTLFMTATLLSGTIWAKAVWGYWWTWEPRLTLTLVTWLMYVGYLLLRRAIADPSVRARTTAVFGILAFFNIPIVHYSVQWWRSIHPYTVGAGHRALHPDMMTALMVATGVSTLLVVVFTALRFRIAALSARVAALDVAEDLVRG